MLACQSLHSNQMPVKELFDVWYDQSRTTPNQYHGKNVPNLQIWNGLIRKDVGSFIRCFSLMRSVYLQVETK